MYQCKTSKFWCFLEEILDILWKIKFKMFSYIFLIMAMSYSSMTIQGQKDSNAYFLKF